MPYQYFLTIISKIIIFIIIIIEFMSCKLMSFIINYLYLIKINLYQNFLFRNLISFSFSILKFFMVPRNYSHHFILITQIYCDFMMPILLHILNISIFFFYHL